MSKEIDVGRVKGLSAYEIAVQNGYGGTLAEWLDSLKGKDGKDAAVLVVNSYSDLPESSDGAVGFSLNDSVLETLAPLSLDGRQMSTEEALERAKSEYSASGGVYGDAAWQAFADNYTNCNYSAVSLKQKLQYNPQYTAFAAKEIELGYSLSRDDDIGVIIPCGIPVFNEPQETDAPYLLSSEGTQLYLTIVQPSGEAPMPDSSGGFRSLYVYVYSYEAVTGSLVNMGMDGIEFSFEVGWSEFYLLMTSDGHPYGAEVVKMDSSPQFYGVSFLRADSGTSDDAVFAQIAEEMIDVTTETNIPSGLYVSHGGEWLKG